MVKRTTLKLGDKVKDTITGYSGIIVAEHRYLNGCLRMTLQPDKLGKEGMPVDGMIFDVEQLALVKASVHQPASPGGGPMPDPVGWR
jgi:hypothetical protein